MRTIVSKMVKIIIIIYLFFHPWSATQPSDMRHPRAMEVADVETFLSMLANERKVSASTQPSAQRPAVFVPRGVGHRFAVARQDR